MKDPKQFRERFKKWKEGTPIEEIYDNGRPTYFDSVELLASPMAKNWTNIKEEFKPSAKYVGTAYSNGKDGDGDILGLKVPSWAETTASFMPFLGTAMDIKEAIQNPSLGNIGTAGLSLLSDISGTSLVRGAFKASNYASKLRKARKTVQNLYKTAGKTEDYSRLINAQDKLRRIENEVVDKGVDLYLEAPQNVIKSFPIIFDTSVNAMQHGIYPPEQSTKKYARGKDGGPKTTSGSGYVPNAINPQILTNKLRQKLYDNISPFSYNNPIDRIASAVFLNKPSKNQEYLDDGVKQITDDLWGTYLQIPKNKRHYTPVLTESKYRPTKSKDSNSKYYAIPYDKYMQDIMINSALSGDTENLDSYLGNYTVNVGYDTNGQYVSYYDKWDLNPFAGITNVGNKFTDTIGLNKIEDASFGIGKPLELYDRIYLDDFYGVPRSGSFYLPEIFISNYKHGKDSGIYIKPSKRGTFTAAAKKRGMSVQSFASKVLNNPSNYSKAMRKKAQFAKNASKFKH